MILSEHFTLDEFIFSEVATRRGIDNVPDIVILQNLKNLSTHMEAVRNVLEVPLKVSSAYRCAALNTLIGGSPNSAHVRGLACDFVPVGMSLLKAACIIRDSKLLYDQLILEYSQWLHLGFDKAMRRECLTKKSGTEGYLRGLV